MAVPINLPPPPPLSTTKVETPPTHTPIDKLDAFEPSPATLPEVYATLGLVETSASQPSKWWSSPSAPMDVDIDGHDFDFTPKKNLGKEKVEGEADGPMNHNGWYKVLANKGDRFEIHVNVGTNPERTNDLNATVSIVNGVATVSGTVSGETLPDGLTATVSGDGTKASPYKIVFTDSEGGSHSIAWRPE